MPAILFLVFTLGAFIMASIAAPVLYFIAENPGHLVSGNLAFFTSFVVKLHNYR